MREPWEGVPARRWHELTEPGVYDLSRPCRPAQVVTVAVRSEERRLAAIELEPATLDGTAWRDAPQLAAWTAVARVLFNLDETITKE